MKLIWIPYPSIVTKSVLSHALSYAPLLRIHKRGFRASFPGAQRAIVSITLSDSERVSEVLFGRGLYSLARPSRYNEQTELFVYWGPNRLLRLV